MDGERERGARVWRRNVVSVQVEPEALGRPARYPDAASD